MAAREQSCAVPRPKTSRRIDKVSGLSVSPTRTAAHHTDFAHRLQLIDVIGQQRPRRMRAERHADGEQRHDGARFNFSRRRLQ
jgi:hypothetical protein